jgi:hypothetical protein
MKNADLPFGDDLARALGLRIRTTPQNRNRYNQIFRGFQIIPSTPNQYYAPENRSFYFKRAKQTDYRRSPERMVSIARIRQYNKI